jgi:hypothetical protein
LIGYVDDIVHPASVLNPKSALLCCDHQPLRGLAPAYWQTIAIDNSMNFAGHPPRDHLIDSRWFFVMQAPC